jgi:putative photosynthetic complex assembly protein
LQRFWLQRSGETGGVIATAEPGTNGFLRGTLRGLMRARKRDGLAYSEPMELERRADGELVLIDSKLGAVIALNAFGRTNAAVFGTMLTEKQGSLK